MTRENFVVVQQLNDRHGPDLDQKHRPRTPLKQYKELQSCRVARDANGFGVGIGSNMVASRKIDPVSVLSLQTFRALTTRVSSKTTTAFRLFLELRAGATTDFQQTEGDCSMWIQNLCSQHIDYFCSASAMFVVGTYSFHPLLGDRVFLNDVDRYQISP